MNKRIPLLQTIPYRNIILDVILPPYPQANGPEWSIENRVMEDYDLFVCDGGRALFEVDGQNYEIGKGMALLLAPGQRVNARAIGTEKVLMVAQHFMLYVFHKTDFFSLIRYRTCVELQRWNLHRQTARQIARTVLSLGENWIPMDTNPMFMTLLNAFISEAYIEEDVREERKSSLVLNIIEEIDRRFPEPELLGDLMSSSAFGYSHTANTFKHYTGLSIKAFIIERRLQAAREALLKGASVREAAGIAGYEDEFYFSRIFRKYVGIPPRSFRERV